MMREAENRYEKMVGGRPLFRKAIEGESGSIGGAESQGNNEKSEVGKRVCGGTAKIGVARAWEE